MGSVYSNVIVIGSDESQVAAACSRPAFLATDGGVVMVYSKADDDGDAPTPGSLSAQLKCITLQVSVHDSDVIYCEVSDRGEMKVDGSAPPDPSLLVAAIGRGNPEAVYNALTDDFMFAQERHAALLAALQLPTTSAGYGYGYLLLEDAGYQGPPLTRLD